MEDGRWKRGGGGGDDSGLVRDGDRVKLCSGAVDNWTYPACRRQQHLRGG
jgi:hypothetical protein